ncbi:MAG TPA: glycosyltransferase [Candidatus Sulfotelmatobacter sp.]|nr:glycosyltransferase [Candidatus Sulfotelmatobacter sp.]
MPVSIIIPTFNGAARIENCLEALLKQTERRDLEILVVNDGSTDPTAEVVGRYSSVRLITQVNAGPAAARNRGALEAKGSIILFTDDDCVPAPDWLAAMIEPFRDEEVVGVKGAYRTHQREIVARFVQLEYEDKYRFMSDCAKIDFIDTYSAGFGRDRFLEMDGYDTSFPVACAEDVELSYRMSARGWTMRFVPGAIVYHTHPDTLWRYLKKKYKFAFWRVLAVRKNPNKGFKDSHTPQLMKLQLLFAPLLLLAGFRDLMVHPKVPMWLLVCTAFLVSTLPFVGRALRKDPAVALLSPVLLAARACAQVLGIAAGLIYAGRKSAEATTESHA